MMNSNETKITPTRGVVACVGEGEELARSIQELSREGFLISQYRSADVALREAGRIPPVAFVMSGGRDIAATCRMLRDDVKHAFTPVFVLSTKDVKDRLGALSAGADECGPFPVCYLGQAIQARRERLGVLRTLTSHDGVAGLLSHQGLKHILPREISRSNRYRWPLCVTLINIDRTNIGGLPGDAIADALGEAFRYGLRDADVVARVGGDEFVILLPHAEPKGAQTALERCRQLFFAIPGMEQRGTFSAGIAQLNEGERDGKPMLDRAFEGLRLAKEKGGNCIIYQPSHENVC
jgi:diguanylate cyclase (GGDEF)-like protein